jgi:hypothetical protein
MADTAAARVASADSDDDDVDDASTMLRIDTVTVKGLGE